MIYPVSGVCYQQPMGKCHGIFFLPAKMGSRWDISWRFKCGMGRIKETLSPIRNPTWLAVSPTWNPTESPPQPTTIVAGSTVAYNITRYHYDIYIFNNMYIYIYIYINVYIYIYRYLIIIILIIIIVIIVIIIIIVIFQ
jgi:hypothetical protein